MPLFEHLTLRAEQRLAAGDGVGGRVLLEEALLQRPGDAGVLRRLTGLLLAADPAGAVRAANDLVAASPGDADALSLLGQALSAAGHAVDAVAAFAGAAGLRPDQGAMQCNLAVALLRAGRPAEAAGAAALSIQLSPGLAEAHAALGHARHALGERDAAMAAFQAALRCRPEHPDALLGIASVQSALGRPATAAVALQRACLAAPHWPNAWMDLGTALLASGNAAEAVDAYAQARALAPADLSAASNLLQAVQYVPSVTPERAASLARDWGEQQPRAAPGRAAAWGRPLRVGYVSADIRQHPVGWLGGGAIAAHDPEAVRVTLYLNQLEEDELTRFVAGRVQTVRRIFGIGDGDVAAQIAQDGIDVLVDLSGHTGGNRLGVFARRPAPVQVSWLGYTATTGLPAMDAVLLDDDHAPPGHEALFTEAILRLPGGRFGYRPPGSAPEVVPPPMLSGAPVTFGSFNNPAKLNAEVVGLWSEVLRAVPGSRLLQRWRSFADPLVTARVRDLFGRNGFDPARLAFAPALPHAEMLAAYGEVDVALDPRPFCGGVTTFEALWMGVPVVTWPGRRTASRQTHAVLRALGCSHWSAQDAPGYVAAAASLVGDPAALAVIRATLRARVAASPLCDARRLARALEDAFHHLVSG